MGIGILRVSILDGTLHILTDHQWTGSCILVPPASQGVVVGSLVANLPVDLGHAVVEPAIVHPQEDICIEVVVVLQTVGVAADL